MKKTASKIMPPTRIGRIIVGLLLIIGGVLGFLPVLGFWMIPLGVLVLSVDFPFIRRWRRQFEVRVVRWWRARKERKAAEREARQQQEGKS